MSVLDDRRESWSSKTNSSNGSLFSYSCLALLYNLYPSKQLITAAVFLQTTVTGYIFHQTVTVACVLRTQYIPIAFVF